MSSGDGGGGAEGLGWRPYRRLRSPVRDQIDGGKGGVGGVIGNQEETYRRRRITVASNEEDGGGGGNDELGEELGFWAGLAFKGEKEASGRGASAGRGHAGPASSRSLLQK